MSPQERFRKLKEKAERTRRDADRAEGEYRAALRDLKSEFGVKSVKAARRLLKKLEAEAKAKEAEFATALAKFEKEHGGDA